LPPGKIGSSRFPREEAHYPHTKRQSPWPKKVDAGSPEWTQKKQREIASKGGKAAHAKGTAHEFTAEEAREAGRKGGQAAHLRGTAHQFTTEEAREAGRKGGRSSRRGNAASDEEAPESSGDGKGSAGARHPAESPV